MIDPAQAMPVRPHEHVLETVSRRKFEMNLDSWVARTIGSDDYGIDLTVEIFRQGFATGDSFAVQLKATREAGSKPTVRVKTSTYNYWAAQPVPALIALWDEQTDRIWYEWAHRVRPPKASAETLTISLTRLWEAGTLQTIDNDVSYHRAVTQLARHTPIEVLVTGETFRAIDSADLKSGVFKALRGIPDLRVRFTEVSGPFIQVKFDDSGFSLEMSGRRAEDTVYAATDEDPRKHVVADVMARLSFALSDVGQLEHTAAELLRRSVRVSQLAVDTERISDVVARLVRAEDLSSVDALIDRTSSNSLNPRDALLHGLFVSESVLSEAQRHQIASHLLRRARPKENGARDYLAAARLYAPMDSVRCLAMFDRAAALDPLLLADPRFRLERGLMLLSIQRYDAAENELQIAAASGDQTAADFLGEAIAFQGRYRDALNIVGRDSVEDARLPRHTLLAIALHHIVDDWGIDVQVRPAEPSNPYMGADDDEDLARAEASIREDALNGWAHWARCPILTKRGASTISELAAAAVGAPYVAQIWDELVREAFVSDNLDLAFRALWCAREFAEDDFWEMLFSDDFLVKSGNREGMTRLFELLPDTSESPLALYR